MLRDIHDTAARGMIAPIETTSTATVSHAVGDLFIYNDLLYKATALISIGDSIVPNTNCVRTTIGEQISYLISVVAGLQ